MLLTYFTACNIRLCNDLTTHYANIPSSEKGYTKMSFEAEITNTMYHTNEKKFQIMKRFIWHLFVGDIRWLVMCLCKHVERTMDETMWPFNDQGWSNLRYKSPYPPSEEPSRGNAWIIAGLRDVTDCGRRNCIGKFKFWEFELLFFCYRW